MTPNYHILIVEDDISIALDLEELIVSVFSYKVTLSGSLQMAQLLAEETFDIIILDCSHSNETILMQFEAAQNSFAPIICLSNSVDSIAANDTHKINKILLKPFDNNELVTTIRQISEQLN